MNIGIAAQTNGALVKAKSDLNGWKAYPAQLEYGFGDGCVRDVKAWKDFIWLATDKGRGAARSAHGPVPDHSPHDGQHGRARELPATSTRAGCILGTERGVCFLDDVSKEDLPTLGELPIPGGVQVFELASKDKDLWAATRYGLHVFQDGAWKSLNQVSRPRTCRKRPTCSTPPSPTATPPCIGSTGTG